MELVLGFALPITTFTRGGLDLNNNVIQLSKKRSFDKMLKYKDNGDDGDDGCSMNLENPHGGNRLQKALIGWPPIKCRRNGTNNRATSNSRARSIKLVKVKMEGVPIGRKVDISLLNSYQALRRALRQMFPNDQLCGSSSWERDEGSSRKERNCKVTYEDEEGDWMLAADVPWETFVESVKRLKILGDQSN